MVVVVAGEPGEEEQQQGGVSMEGWREVQGWVRGPGLRDRAIWTWACSQAGGLSVSAGPTMPSTSRRMVAAVSGSYKDRLSGAFVFD